LAKFYTEVIKFHILLVIRDFLYLLQKTLWHYCWRMGCRRRSVNMEGATTHSRLRAALT